MYRRVITNNELISFKRGFFGMYWFPWRNYDREVSYLAKKESELLEEYRSARGRRIVAETNVKYDKQSMQAALLSDSRSDFVYENDIDILSTRSGIKYDYNENAKDSNDVGSKGQGNSSKPSGKGGSNGEAKPLGSLKVKGRDGKDINLASLKVLDQ